MDSDDEKEDSGGEWEFKEKRMEDSTLFPFEDSETNLGGISVENATGKGKRRSGRLALKENMRKL